MISDYHIGLQEAMIVEAAELNLVKLHGLVPFKDGDHWCYLLGPNLQEGVAGFGKTIQAAACDFNKNYYKELS